MNYNIASSTNGFKQFVYNPETRAFLGRTAKSWAKISGAYACLYTFLGGFFLALLSIALSTTSIEKPKWTLDDGLIGVTPGIGYRPLLVNGPRFEIDRNNIESLTAWTKSVEEFLKVYKLNQDARQVCDYGRPMNKNSHTEETEACGFRVPELVNCNAESGYGYSEGNPCFFLKMNKIYDWQPEPYSYSDIVSNEMGMPEDLQQHIMSNEQHKLMVENNVWVSCNVTGGRKDENTGVVVTYEGHRGFPTYYYPYTNQDNYVSPFIVVKLSNLPTTDVKLQCRLWAKNIHVIPERRVGMSVIYLEST